MWTPPVLSTGRLGAEDRCVLFASVRLCPLLLPAIATGFGQKMPILGRKMVDSRSDSWRRGRDSNPGTFQSAVFKGAPERSRGSVSVRFEREVVRLGASPSASVRRRRCQRSCQVRLARSSSWRLYWSGGHTFQLTYAIVPEAGLLVGVA